ncbi:uncharacterized protein LOC130897323 isoform X2 [Diorhabda carinulata]|nr:uncharacterized protein LOC130897323 isoform X2 [Diorhabda carinulata]
MGPTTPHLEHSSADDESAYTNETGDHKIDHSNNEDKTVTEDQPLTTDCDQSILATDNCTMQDTDISMALDHSVLMDNMPVKCICPPPALPADIVYNSECMCPQMANYIHSYNAKSRVEKKKSDKVNVFSTLFKHFKDKKNNLTRNRGYYTINIQQSQKNFAPKRLVFDLVDNIASDNIYENENITCPDTTSCFQIHNESKYRKHEKVATQTTKKDGITNDLLPVDSSNNPLFTKKKKFNQKTTYTDLNGATRVDVYYFDHGCASYFRTTDRSPVIATEDFAEKTEAYTTKFWAEIFGSFNIGCSFLISLILQFVRFFLYSILRPLTVGLIQLISDYFFKPILTTLFNAVIQPVLIFFYNIVTSLRDICDPLAEAIGYFFREFAVLIRAFRIIEVNSNGGETICNRNINKKNKFLNKNKTDNGFHENKV